jgi:SAM-dependent methyltransferase
MGLGIPLLRDIAILKQNGGLQDCRRVVEIGAQQLNDRLVVSPVLGEIARIFGVARPNFTAAGSQVITSESPPGRLLWSALGMESQSVDIEGGDIAIDLNKGDVPLRYRGAFDLAVNAGTTEHVANQGNAFSTIHDLVRVGGLMYHELPAYGHVDHGFFGYQPKFFWRLAEANNYEIVLFHFKPNLDLPFPDYLREKFEEDRRTPFPEALREPDGLPLPNPPPTVTRATVTFAFRRKDAREFSMPVDR